jgi:hypothetical protein
MIRLSVRALSLYGKKVTSAIRASEPALNDHCSCPPGQSCTVEITELPGRRFEAVVTRPRPVTESRDWSAMTIFNGMYRRLFEKRSTAKQIREAVASMVGAPLQDEAIYFSPLSPSTEDLNIILVDAATLRRAQTLSVGCQVCSPFAEIPFDSILDRVTGHDPLSTRYIIVEGSAKCPRCLRQLNENTLVEFEPAPGEAAS